MVEPPCRSDWTGLFLGYSIGVAKTPLHYITMTLYYDIIVSRPMSVFVYLSVSLTPPLPPNMPPIYYRDEERESDQMAHAQHRRKNEPNTKGMTRAKVMSLNS